MTVPGDNLTIPARLGRHAAGRGLFLASRDVACYVSLTLQCNLAKRLMKLSMQQAVEATGKSRQTLWRDVRKGSLKAEKDGKGRCFFETGQLIAVYGELKQPQRNSKHNIQPPETSHQTDVLHAEMEGLRRQLATVEGERDDLRRRLDQEAEERRALTRQIVDLRERESAGQAVTQQITELTNRFREIEQKRGGWWSRLLGRS